MSVCLCFQASAQAPAFPGAEGYARYAVTGGRGGKVIHVTNLNDSGEGSLREALKTKGSRIIVFDVAGYIDLKSELVISAGDVTIAGQTAPAPGITLRYYTLRNEADNVIMRFIRVRRSQVKDVNESADATWGRQHNNIILDHCSFSWSIDETASYYDNRNFTMQWCSISESLNNAGHGKGEHGYGGIWGGKGASFHHNLVAHHNNRTPRINSARYAWDGYDKTKFANSVVAERVDLRNCVIYNWGTGNGAYGNMGGYLNIVNNYYKAGPATTNKTRVFQCSVDDGKNKIQKGTMGLFYIKGNYMASAQAADYDWKGVKTDGDKSLTFTDQAGYYGSQGAKLSIKLDDEVDQDVIASTTTTHSADKAFTKVLDYAGASLFRDEVDARHMEEVRTGTAVYSGEIGKGIIDKVNDPGETAVESLPSFPTFTQSVRPSGYDTDGDGMPDEWERANGLNPNNAADGNVYTLDSKKWYTNVEVYINSIVEDIVKAQNSQAESGVDEYYPVVSPAAVSTPSADAPCVVAFDYYSLDGKPVTRPAHGVYVRCTVFSDGKTVSELVKAL